jgi:Kef-type K+ transport system membrane component KefB
MNGNRILAVFVLAGLMALARWTPIPEVINAAHQATMSLGFILIFGFLAGHFGKELGLPGITGYILAGILCGPYVGRFLTPATVGDLQLIDDLALALIAFSAGGELRIQSLRPRIRNILAINFLQTAVIFLGMIGLTFVLFHATRFIESPVSVFAVAIVFGLFGVANSPATGVALINETRAAGVFTDTVLGVTVVKDVVVLILITALLPFIRVLAAPGVTFDPGFIGDLALELGGSLAGGVILGALVTFYMRGVGAVLPLFIVGVAVLAGQVSRQFHLEPLLLCMVAGFVIENATSMGRRFIEAIERSSLPVYVVFFAIGGAAFNLDAVRSTWFVALVFVVVRAGLIAVSTAAGEALAGGANSAVKRWGWMGFLPQAGVTLGLASIVARKFPDWGPEVKTIALAMIAMNQVAGPIAFRWALLRSGEAGRAKDPSIRGGLTPARDPG